MSLAQGDNTPTRPRIEPGSPDPESDALTTRPVRNCSIYVAKSKTLISRAFVFPNAKSRGSHETVQIKHLELTGERSGLVMECLTPKREVGVRYLPPPCYVLDQRHIYSPKSTGNAQEAVAPSRHD